MTVNTIQAFVYARTDELLLQVTSAFVQKDQDFVRMSELRYCLTSAACVLHRLKINFDMWL